MNVVDILALAPFYFRTVAERICPSLMESGAWSMGVVVRCGRESSPTTTATAAAACEDDAQLVISIESDILHHTTGILRVFRLLRVFRIAPFYMHMVASTHGVSQSGCVGVGVSLVCVVPMPIGTRPDPSHSCTPHHNKPNQPTNNNRWSSRVTSRTSCTST